ncbi:MAG: SEC-C metal-binding domain-containing protein [Anaerolineae bacterium]
MASVGRNDPCPCGSGKKYKRCHWRIDQQIQRQNLQLERAWETLGQRIWQFGVQGRLVTEFASAWDLYWDNRIPLPAMSALGLLERSRFLDWYVFDYRTSTRQRVAEAFVIVQGAELSPLEQDLIHDWVKTHVSVYDVTGSADDRLDLQDVFTDEVRSADPIGEDQSMLTDSLLMGRLLPVGGSLRFAPGVMPLLPDAGEALREFVQPRFEAWQQARYGADWTDFLNEAGYLLNHFLIQDLEPIEAPALDQPEMDPAEAARAIARRMQGQIITTALDLHYERWLDEPMPEWNDKTPREMVETPDGAEMVQMLLDMLEEIEQERAESGQPAYDMDLLRRKLGLTGEVRTEGGIVLPG